MIPPSGDDNDLIFSRRALILCGGKLVLLSAILGRMYYLQVLQAKKYTLLAEKNRIQWRFLTPERGRVLDGKGREIATNQNLFRALISHDQKSKLREVVTRLQPILNLSEQSIEQILQQAKRNLASIPTLIKDNLSWDEVTTLETHSPNLPGVFIDFGKRRFYPYSFMAAHLIGYVAAPSKQEMLGNSLLSLPGIMIGKSGIEKAQENLLQGKPGHKQLEINAFNQVVRFLNEEPSTRGQDCQLSIDLKLQEFSYEQLKSQSGALVVMDVCNGEIKALLSTPSFDPNLFVQGLPRETWTSLIEDERTPLVNKAVSGLYAPGSAFKMVVALAALENKVITPATYYHCPGYVEIGTQRFHCWHKHGHGEMNVVSAISHSCDVFFYMVAHKLNMAHIVRMSQKFGFGGDFGLTFPGVKAGFMPTPEWKKTYKNSGWSLGDNINSSIGQGYILTTPLQLAVMTARLATNLMVTPSFLKRPGKVALKPLDLNHDDLNIIWKGMKNAIYHPGGTAFNYRPSHLPPLIAGKTATAQVKGISLKQRLLNRLSHTLWKEKDHALFVGYAPFHAPKYAIALVVEHGGSGAKVASPLAMNILLKALDLQA